MAGEAELTPPAALFAVQQRGGGLLLNWWGMCGFFPHSSKSKQTLLQSGKHSAAGTKASKLKPQPLESIRSSFAIFYALVNAELSLKIRNNSQG